MEVLVPPGKCWRCVRQKAGERWIHDGPKFKGGTDWHHCSRCGAKETGVYVKRNFCITHWTPLPAPPDHRPPEGEENI